MCTFIWIYIYVYIYTYTYVCTCTYTFIYTYIHTYVHMYTYVYTYIYMNIYTYIRIHIYSHVYIYICILHRLTWLIFYFLRDFSKITTQNIKRHSGYVSRKNTQSAADIFCGLFFFEVWWQKMKGMVAPCGESYYEGEPCNFIGSCFWWVFFWEQCQSWVS